MHKLKNAKSFSKPQLLVFIIVFAAIGYLIFKSFAAPNPSLPGDLNNDNTVNITDMSILLSNYGTSNSTADINSDGTVNVLDMSILLSNYGRTISGASTINATTVTHTVDGQLSESDWNLSNSVAVTKMGTPNNTTTFGVMWDSNYLYLGAKVLDNSLKNDSTSCWDDDSVEFYIDANNNGGTSYDADDKQITQPWNDTALCGLQASTPGVLHVWTNVSGGYTVEIAVPWSSLGVTPSSGMTLGIDVCNNDDDDGGAAEIQTCWNGAGNDSQNPSAFGHMTLSGTPSGGGSGGGGGSTPPSGSYWSATSPFNTPIPANPQVRINYNTGPLVGLSGIGFNTKGWGAAFFDDQPNRPRVTVRTYDGKWAVDGFPVPAQLDAYVSAMAALSDSERHNDVVDGDKVWNLYDLSKNSSGVWQAGAMGVLRYGGSGVWNNNMGPWLGRASGFASTAGAVRKSEMDSGVVNHAITFGWPKDRIGPPISPAVTSDGSCTSNCAPMGSRLQLDPTLTDSQLMGMGISSYYLPLAHALQKYGGYIADSTSWMAIYAESWNNNGQVTNSWPSTGWYPASTKLVPYLRIVEPPAAPVLDDRTIFGLPHS